MGGNPLTARYNRMCYKNMINLPAICDNCGTVFNSGIVGGGGATITMIGSKSGPCPRCGEMGSIPDGTYRLIENVIEILSAPHRTIEDLLKISELIKEVEDEQITKEEFEEEVQKKIPELHPFFDWFVPRTREEKFNIGWKIIGAALPIIISSLINRGTTKDVSPEIVINNIYNEQIVNIQTPNNTAEDDKTIKVGRNEPCPCGSGLKYKKCHWKLEY